MAAPLYFSGQFKERKRLFSILGAVAIFVLLIALLFALGNDVVA